MNVPGWDWREASPSTYSLLGQSGARAFSDRGKGAPCRNSTVSSDRHLEIGHQWSDHHHFDSFVLSRSVVADSL